MARRSLQASSLYRLCPRKVGVKFLASRLVNFARNRKLVPFTCNERGIETPLDVKLPAIYGVCKLHELAR
jgi:hypothetical protein